jgi:hypothetical protein
MHQSKPGIVTVESGQSPLGRRLLVLQLAAAPALLVTARDAGAEQVQRPPVLPAVTDADPVDGPGRGRGRPRGTGLTDADPGDGPGNGRGARRGTGLTDADPGDGPGNGRGARQKAMTDSDPRDEAGRGRRGT